MKETSIRSGVSSANFPRAIGIYVLYADETSTKPLYIGKAATEHICDRWHKFHLYSRAGGSALRRTLGVHLGLVKEKLRWPERYYPADVEEAITAYLRSCHIEFQFAQTPEEIATLELDLIKRLKPLLNVVGNLQK